MKETRRLTYQALKHWTLLAATILAFAATVVFALALLTYWLGVWGDDVLRVEITVAEGLVLSLAISAAIGATLQYSRLVEREFAVCYGLRIEGGKVIRGTEEISLTRQEFGLLACLMREERSVCEYRHIFEQVWQEKPAPDTSPDLAGRDRLTALVRRLRDKITIHHDYIKNHPGRGYEFVQWEG